jgi:hypothetical protein
MTRAARNAIDYAIDYALGQRTWIDQARLDMSKTTSLEMPPMPGKLHPLHRRTALTLALSLFFAAAPATPPVDAGSRKPKAPCKQIKEAVQAGRTLDQIMAEFQVDERQVTKCTQAKGKRRKEKKSKAAKPAHATHAN